MIAIFGGTTEGRIAARVCDDAATEYIYSTRSEEQRLLATFARRLTGAMDVGQMAEMVEREAIDLIIDAAHPFAQILHENIAHVASKYDLPVVRFERMQGDVEYDNVRYFDTMEDVAAYVERENLHDILALTGVKSAAAFSGIASSRRIALRVMDRELSHREIERVGFPESNVLYYDLLSSSEEQNSRELCLERNIKAIITKESGESGGFGSKVKLAKELNIPLLIVRRPAIPHSTQVVYGEFGLRRAIEELCPKFFALRTGFTTGSAATAASVAALHRVVGELDMRSVEITLPNGEPITIPVESTELRSEHSATGCIVKDGGDDPDATHQLEIIAHLKLTDDQPQQITIKGGMGVGVVTLPGVGIEIGEAAINPVPREMIETNIRRALKELSINRSVEITIEVPRGESVGAKSFNPRLGIMGGISILGTSGIVQPFSAEAFLESIQRQIQIAKAIGYNKIVINSGAMSERYLRKYSPELPPQCYIHYGNLIGATIELASREGIEELSIGCMIGKAVKLANGALDTHSKGSIIDRNFILELAAESHCSADTVARIASITTARELWSIVPHNEYQLFRLIAQRCFDHCKPLFPNGKLELLLINESGTIEVKIS